MTLLKQFPATGVEGFKRIVKNGAKSRRPTLILGYPGVGKTSIAAQLCREMGLLWCYFDLGNQAREDALLPAFVDVNGVKTLVQVPLNALRLACENGCMLVIDETGRLDKSKQALAMQIANERVVGSYKLHPDTVVVLMGNDSSSGGNYSYNDALLNRCCVIAFKPTLADVRGFFTHEIKPNDPDPGVIPIFAALCSEYAAMSGMRTELFQLEPPEGNPGTYASPRAVHQAMDRAASHLYAGGSVDDIMITEIKGSIGETAAAAWFALLGHKDKLPTDSEVIADPLNAKMPPDIESAIAAMGLLSNVCRVNPDSAWLYLDRYAAVWKDAAPIAAKTLGTFRPPLSPAAQKVHMRLLGQNSLKAARVR